MVQHILLYYLKQHSKEEFLTKTVRNDIKQMLLYIYTKYRK